MCQHRHRLFGLGLEDHVFGDLGLRPPLAILAPLFGQVQVAIQKDVTLECRIAQKGADLTVLDLARRARVLAFDPHRALALFDEAGLVHHADAVFVAKNLNRKLQQAIPSRICTPLRLLYYALHGIRDPVTDCIDHLPAVLARYRCHQPSQVLGGLRTWLLATKNVSETSAELQEICAPVIQILGCYQPSGGLVLPPLSAEWLTCKARL
jgi:hypothetical protein